MFDKLICLGNTVRLKNNIFEHYGIQNNKSILSINILYWEAIEYCLDILELPPKIPGVNSSENRSPIPKFGRQF